MSKRHTADHEQQLSELLQLKRAEKPAPEFWEDFDRKLQSKLLQQAVVRPCWRERLARWVRPLTLGLPATAAAALVVTVHLHSIPGNLANAPATLRAPQASSEAALALAETEGTVSLPATTSADISWNLSEEAPGQRIPARYAMSASHRGHLEFTTTTFSAGSQRGPVTARVGY